MFYVLFALRALLRERGAFAHRAEPQSRRAARSGRARHGRRRRPARSRSTASSSSRDCGASAPAACSRACARCSPSPAATPRRATELRPRASSPARASMPPADSPTCRSASPACCADDQATARPARGRARSHSTASGATSRRRCRKRRWPTLECARSTTTRTRFACTGAEWHQGVVGIVASRLKDRYHRPAIVFARGGDGELRGSGRAIAGFHLRDALDLVAKRAPGMISRFGGHAYAAGLSLARSRRSPASPPSSSASAREWLSPAQLQAHDRNRRRAGGRRADARPRPGSAPRRSGARAFRRPRSTPSSR